MGQIALAILMAETEDGGGIKVGSDLKRKLGNLSHKTHIPIEELEAFSKAFLVRFIGRAYGMRHVSLTMDDPIKP